MVKYSCLSFYFCAFFFFQAEDGIRDLVRSRGLGDVYKRQVCVKGLRDKLEPDPRRPQFLVTEAGIGYRLRPGDLDEE